MFASQASTGTGYTMTIAYLAAGLIFSPVLLFASRPFTDLSVGLAIGCSAACLALAWTNWKKLANKSR